MQQILTALATGVGIGAAFKLTELLVGHLHVRYMAWKFERFLSREDAADCKDAPADYRADCPCDKCDGISRTCETERVSLTFGRPLITFSDQTMIR